MRRILLFLATIFVAGIWHSALRADDVALCNRNDDKIDNRIEACSRVIRARKQKVATIAVAYNNRGFAYQKKGNDDRAIADYSEAIRLDPIAIYYRNRGWTYLNNRDYGRAISDYSQAIRLDPKDWMTYNNRGLAYDKTKNYDRAISDYSEAIRLDPNNLVAYNNRGITYANKGEHNRALADFQTVLRMDPSNATALQGRELAIPAIFATSRDFAGLPAAAPKPDFPQSSQTPTQQPAASERPVQGAFVAGSRRVALVMGNSAYRHVSRLDNTINDARTMRDTLTRLGFEVIYGENLDRRAMGRHIGEFGTIVKDADAAIVYFAGHGSTFGDIPYVVPVDSKYEKLDDIPSELIQVETLVSELRRAKGVRLVILDACRDNEREIELRRQDAVLKGTATRGGAVSRGLARLANPDGLIVVYSTQHMTTAADGKPGGNSPFTGVLARHLVTPNVDIKDVLFRTANEVIKESAGTQRPEISISLFEPFVLVR